MGGSSGGDRKLSLGELAKIREAAKKSISQAAAPQRRAVFISFAMEDEDEVNLFRGQAKNENSEIDFIDRSVKEPFESRNEDYIKRKLTERIKQCSLTIVYLSRNAGRSKWVEWEVEESLRLGKKVVAIHKGPNPAAIPDIISRNKIKVIPWDAARVATELQPD